MKEMIRSIRTVVLSFILDAMKIVASEDHGSDEMQQRQDLVSYFWNYMGSSLVKRYSMFPRAVAGCGHGISNCMQEQLERL